MPLIAISALRYIIIAAVQMGIWTVLMNWVLPLLNSAISEVMQFFGVSEEEATDILANEYLEMAESVGIFAATIASKTPIKVAERLGFTSKGWGKRTLKSTTKAKVTTAKAGAKITTAVNASLTTKANEWATVLLKVMGVPVGVGLLITNTIDFGAWPSSAYQTSVQNFLAVFGLKPDADMRQPRTTSADMFTKVYTAFKNGGVTALTDPYKNQSVIFTRDTLLDLTDRLAGDMLLEGKTVTAKMLITALMPLTNLKAGQTFGTPTSSVSVALPAATTTPTKVFVGVMSQGVLGEKLTFTERQDDLITSMTELNEAATNNLAPWLVTLLGRVIYEIKLVNSVQTKEGVTLFGSTQKFIASYTTRGQARYKTVTNRFAILNLYIMTDKGSRIKIAQITLGPTDAVKLQPTLAQLGELTTSIGQTVTTTNVGDINTIATSAPVTITTPTVSTPPVAPVQQTQPVPTAQVTPTSVSPSSQAVTPVSTPVQSAPAPVAPAPVATSSPAPSAPKPNFCMAGNLSEFYNMKGLDLPALSQRALVYEGLGLGPASYYVGSAEQNVKLLAAQKVRYGCS